MVAIAQPLNGLWSLALPLRLWVWAIAKRVRYSFNSDWPTVSDTRPLLSTPGPEYTPGEHCTIHPIDTPYPQQIDQILAQILHQRSNPDRRNLSSRAESKNRPPGASTL